MYDIAEFLITHTQNNIFNIFSHTVFKEAKISQNYAAIDTGACVYGGKLTAIKLGTMEIIQENLDKKDN